MWNNLPGTASFLPPADWVPVSVGPNSPGDAAVDRELCARHIADLTALKLVLFGESVIDLPRLWFTDRAAVDAFLRLNAFDTDNPLDLTRLYDLHHEATVYLTEAHRYRLPLAIEQPAEIHDLLLAAAGGTAARMQRFACMTLKVMHIMHHISGRELLFNTPISEAQLFDRLNTRVFGTIDRMRATGIGVKEFAAGKKSKTSLATKLLSKRNNLATHIFDKLRFRIVVNTRDDLVQALIYLLRNLCPFNYVLPEQSQNSILTRSDMARVLGLSEAVVQRVWESTTAYSPVVRPTRNEFSAETFRTVNFVADIPLRIDDVAPQHTPAIAFVQTEIQLVDAETSRINERGDSSHALYKKRQRARVRLRLESQGCNLDSLIDDARAGSVPPAKPPAEPRAPLTRDLSFDSIDD
jgi:uncharacterized protein (TIGR04552 family)